MGKIQLFSVLMTLNLSACIFGGSSHSGPKSSQGTASKPLQSFLWQVNKGQARNWLFGTIHAGVDAESEMPPEVLQALESSPCFVMETDPSQVNSKELFELSRLPDEQSLDNMLSKAHWEKLLQKLQSTLPEAALKTSQPWFAAMLYLQELIPPGASMDRLLLDRAKAGRKKIVALENWQDAVTAFAKVIDIKDLDEMVSDDNKLLEQNRRLINAYRSGDGERLSQLMLEVSKGQASAQSKLYHLLAARNQLWLPRLDEAIADGGCFVAVGAGHMIGESNLLDLLEKRGYQVHRVEVQAGFWKSLFAPKK